MGDVVHYMRQPPQLYVFLVGFMCLVVYVGYLAKPAPQPRVVYVPQPQYVPPQPQYIPPQQQYVPPPTITPPTPAVAPPTQVPDAAPVQTPPLSPQAQEMRAAHARNMLPNFMGIQFKNKCPTDYIYFDSLGGCTVVLPNDRIRMEAGSTFRVSRPVTIFLVEGSIHLKNAMRPLGNTFTARINIRTRGGQITALTPTRIGVMNIN